MEQPAILIDIIETLENEYDKWAESNNGK